MKNSVSVETQTAPCQPHEAFGMTDGRENLTINTPEQPAHHRTTKNNIIELSEDLRLKQLTAENQRLKTLVENLAFDKLNQAQRIMELNKEKSRLKKALADLILECQN